MFAYSWDEEHFNGPFDSREAAIEEAFAEDKDHDEVYIGEGVPFEPACGIAAAMALEWLEEQAGDDVGEVAEVWTPSSNKALLARISDAIRAAIRELDEPTIFTVKDVRTHERDEHREG
jgi:hypothetical protein